MRSGARSVGETIVELPAFRHRAREFQPVPGWEQRDYNDSSWEQVYTVRDGAMFVHSSPVLLRGVLPPGAKAIETPLPVTGEYVLYVNGVELDKRLGPPPQPGESTCRRRPQGSATWSPSRRPRTAARRVCRARSAWSAARCSRSTAALVEVEPALVLRPRPVPHGMKVPKSDPAKAGSWIWATCSTTPKSGSTASSSARCCGRPTESS